MSAPANIQTGNPGELAELIGAFNEVTARLQGTHDQLRGEVARLTRELGEANQQLERSRRLAALGEMAAGIAHEVRNPLGSIRLYARMLDQDLAGRDAEREIVRRIDTAARGLDIVVSDVLTFAKEIKVRTEPVSVKDLLQRCLEACRHDGVPGWDRTLVVWDVEDEAEIDADPGLAQQAFVNIIRNAFEAIADHTASACRLTLAFRRTEIQHTGQRTPAVAIRVCDTGPGISDDVLKRMFNPFFTTRHVGTGLGLSIVHRIMDAHGGRVSVRNNPVPGGGAIIELVFPVKSKVAGTQTPAPTITTTSDRARMAMEAA